MKVNVWKDNSGHIEFSEPESVCNTEIFADSDWKLISTLDLDIKPVAKEVKWVAKEEVATWSDLMGYWRGRMDKMPKRNARNVRVVWEEPENEA